MRTQPNMHEISGLLAARIQTLAQGLLGAMVAHGRITPAIDASYHAAGAHVIGLLVEHLPPDARALTAMAMARGGLADAEAQNGA